jgi:Cof subfamily protein (haloacid dehalogenase superfamily)
MTLHTNTGATSHLDFGRVELIASDMDGTLLDGDHGISSHVLSAIGALETLGRIPMCIATGRSRSSAMRKLEAHGLDWLKRPGVFLNGAVVYGSSGELIFENKFSHDLIESLVREFAEDRESIVVMPCAGDSIHSPQMCEISLHLHKEYSDPMPTIHDGYDGMLESLANTSIHMIGFMTKDCRETEKETFERVRKVLSRCESPEEFSVVLPIPRMVTIMPRNTSKGAGLLALCRHLSICPSRVAAVGDAGNDIEMIQSVGFGVAMGNAKDEVKKHAKLVVNPNDHPELPGVAQLLSHVIQSVSTL